MLKKIFLTFFAALLLAGCTPSDEVINVYSGRHYQTDEELFRAFTRQTGIQVNLVKADTDQLIKRLELEGANSPADLLITADAGRLTTAKSMGLLQPFESALVSEVVPRSYRDRDGTWTGMTARARVIVFHRDRVRAEDLSTYEALAGPQWKGRVLVRSSQNHYNQTLMASVVAALGPEAAESWARGLVENMARSPQGNDRDQVKALAAGTGDVAIVNTYYMGLLLNSTNAEEKLVAQQAGIFFPNQNDRGTHVNISGIGLTRHAPNRENAIKLIEFMLSDPAQKILSEENYEYPISTRVPWPFLLQQWGTFRADTLSLSDLQPHLQEAMFIFNRAGWQ
jgi:iron(III) transport system substrate-binding protein